MNTLLIVVVIANCAIASNEPKTRFKRDGWSVDLANAIIARNEAEAIRLIEAGASINAVDGEGKSPMHYAAQYGQDKIVKNLIDHNADVNAKDKWEMTPLYWAASKSHDEVMKTLIDHGANVNAKNKNQTTPLHWAAYKGHGEMVKFLIDHNADVDAKDEWGETPLQKAASQGHDEVVKILIDHNADVNVKDKWEMTPLYWAASQGHDEVMKTLIDHGANVNAKNKNQTTSLHWAAYKGHGEMVKFLIDHNADVDAKDRWQWTPLVKAASQGHDTVVKLLVNNGADINIKTLEGKTARDIAAQRGNTKIADWLDAPAPKVNAATVCAKYSVEEPSDFISGGAPVKPEELPWMAALGYADVLTSVINYQCGGTIISERFILTAAHCTKLGQPPILVRLGNVNLAARRRTKNYYIKDIIPHESYSSEFKKNDIALLRLLKDIKFTLNIRPACLETNLNDLDTSAILITSGWGANTTLNTEKSSKLMKAEVRTIPLSQCNATYLQYNQRLGSKVFRNGVSQSQYCANNPVRGGGSCHGDSGGPLQIFHNLYTAHVVGIVSFGVSCGSKLPTIYTRVAYYVDWISSHVWNG